MEKDGNQEALRDYAAMIRDQRYQLENDLDRYLFSLGGGSAILSVTLFSVLPKPLNSSGFLVASWICSAVTLISVFSSIKFSIKGRDEAFIIAQQPNPDFSKLDKKNNPIKLYGHIAFWSSILALMLLGVFAANNIGDENGKTEKHERKVCACHAERTQSFTPKREIRSDNGSRSQTNTSDRLRTDQNP